MNSLQKKFREVTARCLRESGAIKGIPIEEVTPEGAKVIRKHVGTFAQWEPEDGMPVEVERVDGSRYGATWSGYYEMPGMDPLHSIGYSVGNGFSHGILGSADRLVTEVPTLAEWKQYRAIIESKKRR